MNHSARSSMRSISLVGFSSRVAPPSLVRELVRADRVQAATARPAARRSYELNVEVDPKVCLRRYGSGVRHNVSVTLAERALCDVRRHTALDIPATRATGRTRPRAFPSANMRPGVSWLDPLVVILLASVLPLVVQLVATAVAAAVAANLYGRTRRDRRLEAADAEQRRRAADLHELLVAADVRSATRYDGPVTGCVGPVADYDEWLQQWNHATALVLPHLPSKLRVRLELLTHLLERSATQGATPYAWSLPIAYGVANVEKAVAAALAGTSPGSGLLPDADVIDDLVSRGITLGTGDTPLVDEIHRRVDDDFSRVVSDGRRRSMRAGLLVGILVAIAVANAAFLLVRLVA